MIEVDPRQTSRVRRCLLVSLALTATLLGRTALIPGETAVFYVDDDAPPGGDGRSWPTSFEYLQDALSAVRASQAPLAEVRIAQGTYRPDAGAGQTPGELWATFLLTSGVTLQGGYAGLGFEDPDGRDPEGYRTILTGELAGGGSRAYHVVTVTDATQPCILDALDIVKGTADTQVPADGPKRGGGLHALRSRVMIRGCRFLQNYANRYQDSSSGGGAIFLGDRSTLLLDDCHFESNWAWGGGAIYGMGSRITIKDSRFLDNHGHSGAGAILSESCDTFVFHSRFERNESYWVGAGAIELSCRTKDSAWIQDTLFVGNHALASGGGGGLRAVGGTVTIEKCRFSENTAPNYAGGAIAMWASEGRVLRCAFDRNRSSGGGAIDIRLSGNRHVVEHCVFTSNSGSIGGAISTFPDNVSIVNCIFVGNRANDGGAIWSAGGQQFRMLNSLFAKNAAAATAGAMFGPAAMNITNCTFAGNSAPDGKSFALHSLDSAVVNSIVWDSGGVQPADFLGTIQHSLVQGGFAGVGNIDADPRFTNERSGTWTEAAQYDEGSASTIFFDAAASWAPGALRGHVLSLEGDSPLTTVVVQNTVSTLVVFGNCTGSGQAGAAYDLHAYRLGEDSPCIDRGSVEASVLADITDLDRDGDTQEPVPLDLAGSPRVDGGRVDMGAYERQGATVPNRPPICRASGPFVALRGPGFATVILSGLESTDPDDDSISINWDIVCPQAVVDDPTSPTPIVTLDLSNPCWLDCNVQLEVTDARGNVSHCPSILKIAPQLGCPGEIPVAVDGTCSARVPDVTGAVFESTPLFGPSTRVHSDPAAGTLVGPGQHEILVSAWDACGHAQSCVVILSVQDADLDGDGQGNCSDDDDDGDGLVDQADNCPRTSNAGQEDGDGDMTGDACDAFPEDPTEMADSDADGMGDQGDLDDDGDGAPDCEDAFPKDPAEKQDTDGDGTGDNADGDDDADGHPDEVDVFPLDELEWCDSDGDRTGDNQDTDDDNDGTVDEEDAFPLDPAESKDTNGDALGDNADPDDDGDNVPDEEDDFPVDPGESKDTDGDTLGDNADPDDDADGVNDEADVFPLDPREWQDDDGDRFGDNGDSFPTDPTEWSDADGDGTGDNRDDDDDNDGASDADDAFPFDAGESADTDKDATGNNVDLDDDGDGVADTGDTDPLSLKPSIEIVEAASDPQGHVQDWRAVNLDGRLYRWKVLTLETQEEAPVGDAPLSRYPGTILGIAAEDAGGEPIEDQYQLRSAFIITEMATLLSTLELSGDNESIPVGYWGDTVTTEDDTGETFAIMRSLLSKSAGSIGQSLEMNAVSGLRDRSAREKIWRDVALSVAVLRGLFSGVDEGENSAEACKDELYSWAERTHRLAGGARNASKVSGTIADLGGAFSTQLIHIADFRREVVDIIVDDLGLLELRSGSPAGSVAKRAAKLKGSMRNLSAALQVVGTVARYAGEVSEALALQAIAGAEGEDRISLLLRLGEKGVFSDPAALQGVRDAAQSYDNIQQSFFDSWAEIRRQATVIESLDELLDLIKTIGAAGRLFAETFPNVAARMAQILPQMPAASAKVLGYSMGAASAILDMAVALDSNLKLLRQVDLTLTMEREVQVYLLNHKDLGDDFTTEEVLELIGANEMRFHLKFLHFKECLGLITSQGYDFYKIILLDIVGGLIWFQGLLHAKTMDEAIADYSEEKAHGKRKALELLEENGLMSRSLWVNLDRYLSSGLAPRSFKAVTQVDLTGQESKWIYARVDNHDSDVRSSFVSFSMPVGLRVVETDLDGLAGQWREYPIGGPPIWHREDETAPTLMPVDTLWECSGPFPGQSTKQIGLRIAAQDDGVYWLRGRVSMLPSTSVSDTRDAYLHAPESGPRDQQGWETVEIDVLSRRAPAPNFIVKNGPPGVVARGQAIDLVVEVSNSGAPSLDGTFHVSHSSGLTLESVLPGSGWTHGSVGDLIWHADGRRIPASEPLSSHQMRRLGSGESLDYVVRFCASEEGAHRILLRCAMAGAGGTELLRFPSDEGLLDQQGWPVVEVPLVVEENKPPVLVAAEPLEHAILKLPDERVALRIEAVDEDNRPEGLSYSWSLDGARGLGETPSIDLDIATLLQQGLLSIGVSHVVSASVSDGLAARGRQWSLLVVPSLDLQVELEASCAAAFENGAEDDRANIVSLEARISDPSGNETFTYVWTSPRHTVTGRSLALVDGGGSADGTAVFATAVAAAGSATPYLVSCVVVGMENGASGVGTTEVLVEPSFVRGDANADGDVDIGDPVTILVHMFLGTPEELDCENTADADDKGTIDLTDAIYLLNYLFLGGTPPRAPFPKCGADASLDDLSCRRFTGCP